ncbi:MAG: Lrp/AsnC family transcriptional regulator [Candidatus Adiutrix sp.]|jgi:DNA-binding Lrp family transcriptional regulator|nr:Lrp/AsnC family transcriptional regulator [Candidatus Adiutrix sp.]
MNGPDLDRPDRLILNSIQENFPVASRPYQALAERINAAHQQSLTEEEVHARVMALKKGGFIRRLGAVFNAGPLGYYSTLCAARVAPERLELFSGLVNRAPQVTHNYLRSGGLNVWFTFTANSPEDLDVFLAGLERDSGVEDILTLEAARLFKIKVNFQFNE